MTWWIISGALALLIGLMPLMAWMLLTYEYELSRSGGGGMGCISRFGWTRR